MVAPLLKLCVVARLIAPASTSSVAITDVEALGVAGASWFTDIETVGPGSIATFEEDLRNCGGDTRCAAARAEQHGIDRLLFVVANLSLEPGLVTVEVVDSAQRRTLATEIGELGAIAETVRSSVRKALARAGHRLGAKLDVNVDPADAVVTLDPPARSGAAFVVPPGKYGVIASRDGYETARREVELTAGEDEVLSISLEEETSVVSSWWLWTAVGAVVVAAAVTVPILLTRPDELAPYDLCAHDPGTEASCK